VYVYDYVTKLSYVLCFLLGNSLAFDIQMPGNYPEESTQHSERGESLKSRKLS